jgi:hypothetical protein
MAADRDVEEETLHFGARVPPASGVKLRTGLLVTRQLRRSAVPVIESLAARRPPGGFYVGVDDLQRAFLRVGLALDEAGVERFVVAEGPSATDAWEVRTDGVRFHFLRVEDP